MDLKVTLSLLQDSSKSFVPSRTDNAVESGRQIKPTPTSETARSNTNINDGLFQRDEFRKMAKIITTFPTTAAKIHKPSMTFIAM